MSFSLGDFFGTSSIETPGLGPVPHEAYKRVIQGTTLNDKQVDRSTEWLENYLKNNPDPSAAAFELSKLSSQYPGVRQFEPGSKIWGKVMDAQNAPISLSDANYLSTTMLGRSLTGDERKYVRKENPSSYKFSGLLAANPRAPLAASPTTQEENLAEFGRMVYKDGISTGKRYATIDPLKYTGGIS